MRWPHLFAAALAWAAAPAPAAEPPRPKPPFRVLYSNDLTHVTSCVSPYHAAGADFTDDQLRASVAEATGADAQLLQPGMGWIPWWVSKEYPAPDHYRYYEQRYGIKPNTFGRYMLAGGDVVRTFVDECRGRRIAPLVSLRLNDGHGLENVGLGNAHAAHTVSRFYEDHYKQWRVGPDVRKWDDHVLDWSVPAVRAHKFAFLRELAEGYDLDGLELDFLRHASFFDPAKTPPDRRKAVMTAFVADVRALLDRTARGGRRRYLGVRVPAMLAAHERLGLDVAALAAAGVDFFDLSCSYVTVQQTDLPTIRRLAPAAAVYLEMTHTTMTGRATRAYDGFPFARTTAEQFYTTARLAHAQGADGVSLFNFPYYREHGAAGRGPFNEPPFEVLPRLADRDFLGRQPQWYFVAASMRPPLVDAWPLPAVLAPDTNPRVALTIPALAPGAGPARGGTVRLRFESAVPGRPFAAALNGVDLRPAEPALKPIAHPYDAFLGDANEYAAFACPAGLVRDGDNRLDVRMTRGSSAKLIGVDVVLP